MPIFAISDLHLCDRGPRDNFAFNGRESRFYNFLKMVEESKSRLLILGDLFDFWQVNMGASINAYLPLLDRLDELGALWIVGNHDNALAPLIGSKLMLDHPLFQRSCHPFEEEIAGRRFAFLHGHESDPYCRDLNPGAGELTAIISGMLEDRHKGPFDRHGHAIEDQFVGTLEAALTLWRTLTFQQGRQAQMVAGVEKYRQAKNCDVVIYGHTHEPGNIADYHFNTGSWARQHDTYVRIEDDGSTGVWEWTGTCSKPYNVTLK